MSANMTFTLRTKIIKQKETFFLFRICCQCKYGVKVIFDVFAQLVIVVQTQSLTYAQIRSTQFKDSICYTCKAIFSSSKFNNLTHLYCNSKVVANMQLFFTFAMVCEHWVNAVFTIFAMRANIMQSPKLHLSKYDRSRSNVVFTSYLLRFCYGGNSVFSSSVNHAVKVISPFLFKNVSFYIKFLHCTPFPLQLPLGKHLLTAGPSIVYPGLQRYLT